MRYLHPTHEYGPMTGRRRLRQGDYLMYLAPECGHFCRYPGKSASENKCCTCDPYLWPDGAHILDCDICAYRNTFNKPQRRKRRATSRTS